VNCLGGLDSPRLVSQRVPASDRPGQLYRNHRQQHALIGQRKGKSPKTGREQSWFLRAPRVRRVRRGSGEPEYRWLAAAREMLQRFAEGQYDPAFAAEARQALRRAAVKGKASRSGTP
jgi:hypothetical protein